MQGAGIRVGVLFSQTGITAVIERTQLDATLLAIEEVNRGGGIDGIPLEPIVYDPASDPAQFRKLAERLVQEDRVPIIFGCYMSSARRAVVPVIEQWNALLCYSTFYEGFEYSPNVLYCGSLPNQTNITLAKFLLGAYGRRVVLLGSDYIFPRESNRLMRSIFAEEGGEIVGERYAPLGSSERTFDVMLAEAKLLRPDVIFSTVVGDDIDKLYRAFWQRGLDAASMPIASITATEAELALLPPSAREGHISAAPYFASIDSPENRCFVRSYQKRFGGSAVPNMCAEAAYFSVFLVAHGIRSAGVADPRALIRSLHGFQFDAPQGAVRVDGENNHMFLYTRIGRADADGQFKIVEESAQSTKPDPYLVDYDLPRRKMGGNGVPTETVGVVEGGE